MNASRRKPRFVNEIQELNYLNDVLRQQPTPVTRPSMRSALARFHTLLKARGRDDGSIMLQDHWSVYYERTGDYASAARCRTREIVLIDKLFAIDGPIEDVDENYLLEKLRALASDLEEIGSREALERVRIRIQELERQAE